jgi:hypothetical protein
VQVQEPTRASVSDASTCVQTLTTVGGRASSRARRLTTMAVVAGSGCSIAAVLVIAATVVTCGARELGLHALVVDAAASARMPLWQLAGLLAVATVTTGVLEHRVSRRAALTRDAARVIGVLAVEVVAARAVLATGVTSERRARAAASLRHSTLDGQGPRAAWSLQAAAFIERTPEIGRARRSRARPGVTDGAAAEGLAAG